jgi:hypothetical protein
VVLVYLVGSPDFSWEFHGILNTSSEFSVQAQLIATSLEQIG